MSNFWHGRVIPYSIGALEFLQNFIENVRDSVTGRSDTRQPTGDFLGKVSDISVAVSRTATQKRVDP